MESGTPIIYNVKEILELYPRDITSFPTEERSLIDKKFEVPPNVFLPIWGQSYKIAKDTFKYLNGLSKYGSGSEIDFGLRSGVKLHSGSEIYFGLKLYVAVFESGSLKHFVKYVQKPKGTEGLTLMNCVIKSDNEVGPERSRDPKHPYHRFLESFNDPSIPDGMYIFSLRDTLLVRYDKQHPFVGLRNFGEKEVPKLSKPKQLLPIFNSTGSVEAMDIPIVEFETLSYLNNKLYKDIDNFKPKSDLNPEGLNLDFDSKIPKAVFRGGVTGCGVTPATNQRLNLTLSQKFKTPEALELLDVGLTSKSKRTILEPRAPLHPENPLDSSWKQTTLSQSFLKSLHSKTLDPSKITLVPKMSKIEQSNYKYVIVIEGNVAAHRLATDMLFNSVILLVDSVYNLWFSYLLKPYFHYVPIKADLSDLLQKISWCKSHNEKCKKIASNARELALKIVDYTYVKESMIKSLTLV